MGPPKIHQSHKTWASKDNDINIVINKKQDRFVQRKKTENKSGIGKNTCIMNVNICPQQQVLSKFLTFLDKLTPATVLFVQKIKCPENELLVVNDSQSNR